MNTLRSSLLVAMGLAAVVPALAQVPPRVTNDPSLTVKQPTTNPELAGASTASRQNEQLRMAEAGNVARGMLVKSPSGDVLGTVASIVPADDGAKGGYVVVASAGGMATPMPYATARTLVRHDSLVVDKTRLENAPKVQQYQKEDGSGQSWQKQADTYWKKYEVRLD